jgi:soluble lytic murein transglycosylase
MRYLLTLFVSVLSLCALTFEQIKEAPRSIAKDYYIWQLLDDPTLTPKQAWELLGHAKKINRKLFLKFAKKIDEEGFAYTAKCMQLSTKELIKQDNDCIEIGLSPYKATKLSTQTLLELSTKLKEPYPQSAKNLQIIADNKPYESLLKSDNKTFFAIFNSVGSKYRQEHFNKRIPQDKISQIATSAKMNTFIKVVVTDQKMQEAQKSLFDVNTTKLSHKATFFLAINAIKYEKYPQAKRYLEDADKKAYFRFDKDKILFWHYQITQEDIYLEKLAKSFDVNIYTQFAYEKLNIIKNNIVSDLPLQKKKDHIAIESIFEWVELLDEQKELDKEQTKALASKLYSEDQEPYAAFMLERAGEYSKHYFITPYLDTPSMQKASKDRVALILALSRQESRFVPMSISTSYALGMMQFMPFVANGIADGRYKKFDLEQMFDPKWAYKFANIHLDYLQKHLDNPLFVAYAYNGGIGYTKRLLKKGLFQKGKYEPWLSMELVNYDETRRYGKKVLSNYIVYKSLVDKEVSLGSLIAKLTR